MSAALVGFKTDGSSLDQSVIKRMTQDIATEQSMPRSEDLTKVQQAPGERFRTVVKTTKDLEVFETEQVGSDVGSDDEYVIREKADAAATSTPRDTRKDENINTAATDIGELVSGVDIITDGVSIDKAFEVFREYEEEDKVRPFKPPEVKADADAEAGGSSEVAVSRFSKDLPAVRIQKMKEELDSLQQELRELEQEEQKGSSAALDNRDISAMQSM